MTESREDRAAAKSSAGSQEGVRDRRRSPSGAAVVEPEAPANPELVERPQRRGFSAEYKQRILREADACREPGAIGALLRREGLYSSLLSKWRQQRDAGGAAALDRKRGRPGRDGREVELAGLRRRLERTEAELEKAKKVIAIQGKVSALLGKMLGDEGADRNTEQ